MDRRALLPIPILVLIAVLVFCTTMQRLAPEPIITATPTTTPVPPSAAPTITAPATGTVAASPTPVLPIIEGHIRSAHISGLMDDVSAERLYEDVFTLANIPSRNINHPGNAEAAEYIFDQFEAAGGNLEVAFDEFPVVWNEQYTDQRNVIATLPGSDPSAGVIIVGAHYDSRTVQLNDLEGPAPGANDNASGTAVTMELARVLAHENPRATIKFIAFSAEEMGKLGSIHYVEEALAHGEDIRAVVALDIVGNAVGPAGEGRIRVFSADPPDSSSRWLARSVAWHAEQYLPIDVLIQPVVDRPFRYSDHVPFSDAGFPAVRLIESVEDTGRQHSALDRPEHISPQYMASVVQVVLASLGNIAFAPDAPTRPRLDDRMLYWSPVEEARGYVVALWEQDQADLRRVIILDEPVTSLILDFDTTGVVSISIAAIGSGGHISLFSPEVPLQSPDLSPTP
jgi:hypothetical protein